MPTVPAPTEIAQAFQRVCRAHPVTLAYLFGSYARGTADAESDLDIAVLVADHLNSTQRFDLRLRLRRTVAEALDFDLDRVDVVILQDVPTLLQYNVIRTGRVLFAREADHRRAFEVAVERRYEDEVPYLDREAEVTLDRILSHTR